MSLSRLCPASLRRVRVRLEWNPTIFTGIGTEVGTFVQFHKEKARQNPELYGLLKGNPNGFVFAIIPKVYHVGRMTGRRKGDYLGLDIRTEIAPYLMENGQKNTITTHYYMGRVGFNTRLNRFVLETYLASGICTATATVPSFLDKQGNYSKYTTFDIALGFFFR